MPGRPPLPSDAGCSGDAAPHPPVRQTIHAVVRERGGVVRVRDLAELGFRRAATESALREARLLRVRPGWVAVPDADPLLVDAARHGVVLSCLTQARRLGLVGA
ncbi:hypothetical protein MRBLWO14_001451 [Microbacterium sp. LWO14-1.2]|uniref:hypothetical protein n=1 Tax=Microbacterium sp. LWO14-1.2 TaxID=3135263 RepID=UPI003138A1F4